MNYEIGGSLRRRTTSEIVVFWELINSSNGLEAVRE